MVKRVLCVALLALALVPATGAFAGPPNPLEAILDEACIKNYENLEGDICVPVDDTGTLQFILDQL